jgi:hypothetical protein
MMSPLTAISKRRIAYDESAANREFAGSPFGGIGKVRASL